MCWWLDIKPSMILVSSRVIEDTKWEKVGTNNFKTFWHRTPLSVETRDQGTQGRQIFEWFGWCFFLGLSVDSFPKPQTSRGGRSSYFHCYQRGDAGVQGTTTVTTAPCQHSSGCPENLKFLFVSFQVQISQKKHTWFLCFMFLWELVCLLEYFLLILTLQYHNHCFTWCLVFTINFQFLIV